MKIVNLFSVKIARKQIDFVILLFAKHVTIGPFIWDNGFWYEK